jgi:beta-N-acetylhexosaminidase
MSSLILQEILREKLGFRGVIISDDMEMKAIAATFDWDEAIVRSANAGIDLFMVCHSPERQEQAIDALTDAVKSGQVERERIDQANLRVVKLFTQYVKPASAADPSSVIGTAEHQAVVDRVREVAGESLKPHRQDPTEFQR